jgi:uncharacterized ferritin-like protein (DUF455 family)
MKSVRHLALEYLAIADAHEKCRRVREADWRMDLMADEVIAPQAILPGRAEKPELVSPHHVPQRSIATPHGRAALIHALAHIELNAVNLALDIVWRFANLPDQFYRDWIGVACEEALHFEMLDAQLATLGYRYGNFAAHNGLWDMAEKTRDDVLARLALVPRVLEARGLDVSPGIRDKLRSVGDTQGAEILQRILDDEIGHVAIGNRWFHALCDARGIDALAYEKHERTSRNAPSPKGPFNRTARMQAGFSEAELDALDQGPVDRCVPRH